MAQVQVFKAQKRTHRFREKQKVWIKLRCANHLYVRFKWRGKGRWVNGVIDRFNPAVGELKEIEVTESFAKHIKQDLYDGEDEREEG